MPTNYHHKYVSGRKWDAFQSQICSSNTESQKAALDEEDMSGWTALIKAHSDFSDSIDEGSMAALLFLDLFRHSA